MSATKTEKAKEQTLLVGAEEIAAMLGTSRRHVLDLAARDGLPHIRLGRFVRFRRESVERWAAETERWPSRNGHD